MPWETDMWGDKRYHSLDHELKSIYGGKVYRLSLSSFCGCPNRDGSIGRGGCIFCSAGGSGDFAGKPFEDIDVQMGKARELVASKLGRKPAGYIAYFQSFSNTYGDPERLKELFLRAMEPEDVLILSVATRPDCLPDEILDMLSELARIKPVWVELGLQTVDEKVAEFINRGYKLPVFEEGVRRLKEAGIGVVVHVIAGLPFEDQEATLRTIRYLAGFETGGRHIDGIKIHLLHVLEGTELCRLYREGRAHIKEYTLPEYADLIADILEILPADIVVHRLTGDAPKRLLVAPLWSGDKKRVLNTITRRLSERNVIQGSGYSKV
ncbi:MAG TPA: TIGR01212 family radical SAM protein [Candidatus Avilachnospira avicola]|nr:TIGR01212 family radical SAM protein [Candidatus Avilachnospira avicola]